MSEPSPRRVRNVFIVVIPLLIILLPVIYSLSSYLFARDVETSELFLEKPDPEHKACVRDTAYMRYHHWELLRGVREEVVRYGMRGEIGLQGCSDCHTSRERFCDRCHNAVSLYPDCFDCHYYP